MTKLLRIPESVRNSPYWIGTETPPPEVYRFDGTETTVHDGRTLDERRYTFTLVAEELALTYYPTFSSEWVSRRRRIGFRPPARRRALRHAQGAPSIVEGGVPSRFAKRDAPSDPRTAVPRDLMARGRVGYSSSRSRA